jgi:hypothetical protein
MITKLYNIFGWKIQHRRFTDAEEFVMIWRNDTRVELSTNWTVWTKGARVCTVYPVTLNDDFLTQQRGQFANKTTFNGHVYKRGSYTFKAVGETEHWCLDHAINDNSAPDLTEVFLPAGQTHTPNTGALILIASGETSLGTAPTPIEIVSDSKMITAITDSVLIIFSRRK